jgi:hypothetical protein
MTIEDIRADTWFKKNYVALRRGEDENVSLDDVQAVFDNIEVCGYIINWCIISSHVSYISG